MAVDFGAVFRVLVTLSGVLALVGAAAGAVALARGGAADGPFLLALFSALLSLGFRFPARAAGGRSRDRASLVTSSVIVAVLGSAVAFLLLLIWALS